MSEFLEPEAYLPHRSPMMLIDAIASITPDAVVCECDSTPTGTLAAHIRADKTIPNTFFIEMMAQTVGVWAGYYRSQEQQSHPEPVADIGLLLSVRGASFAARSVPLNARLTVCMNKVIREGQLASFDGDVRLNGQVLASARVTVYQPLESQLQSLFA